MSSLVVRAAFRAEIVAYLATLTPAIPFYETVNTRQDPKDNTWVTLEFDADYSEKMTIGCSDKEEYGTVDVNIYTRAGKGDAEALTLAESIAKHFETFVSGAVKVEDVMPPTDAFSGDAFHWYGVYLPIEYVYYA